MKCHPHLSLHTQRLLLFSREGKVFIYTGFSIQPLVILDALLQCQIILLGPCIQLHWEAQEMQVKSINLESGGAAFSH